MGKEQRIWRCSKDCGEGMSTMGSSMECREGMRIIRRSTNCWQGMGLMKEKGLWGGDEDYEGERTVRRGWGL